MAERSKCNYRVGLQWQREASDLQWQKEATDAFASFCHFWLIGCNYSMLTYVMAVYYSRSQRILQLSLRNNYEQKKRLSLQKVDDWLTNFYQPPTKKVRRSSFCEEKENATAVSVWSVLGKYT